MRRGRGLGLAAAVLSMVAVAASGSGTVASAASLLPPSVTPRVASAPAPSGGQFHALTPARVLDTRVGTGASKAPLGPGGSVVLQISGRGGVPVSGVDSVVVNVTVTGTVGPGYVTVFPAGQPRPTASNLNYTTGQTVANLVVVKLGTSGQVTLYNAGPRADLIADVAGWYSTTATDAGAGGLFNPLTPARILDTRSHLGGSVPGTGGSIQLQVTGQGGVPTTGVSAVVLNLTATAGTAATYVTAYPAGGSRPLASNLNVAAHQTIANRVLVGVGAGGKITLFNAVGVQQLIADVAGYYTDASDSNAPGGYFTALTPHRVLDTRNGTGGVLGALAGGHTLTVDIAGTTGVPAAGGSLPATAVVANITATGGTANTYLTAFPGDQARPLASDLNPAAGHTVPNLVVVKLAADGTFTVFNAAGSVQVIVDVLGYVNGNLYIPDTTTVEPAAVVAAVTGPQGAPTDLILTAGTPPPPTGQVLVSGSSATTPDGLLATVTGTSTNPDGTTAVTLAPATLLDAVPAGDLTARAVIGADNTGAVVAHTASDGVLPRTTPITRPVDQKLSCSGTAFETVTGSLAFTDDVTLAIRWGGFLPHVTQATVTGTAAISSSLSITVSGGGTCGADIPLGPAIQLPAFDIQVGPVPVVVRPQVQLHLKADGTITADLTTGVTANLTVTAGMSYDNGSLHPIASAGSNFTYQAPNPTLTAQASAGVSPEVDFYVYGVAGPSISLNPALQLSVQVNTTPWWALAFDLSGDAGIKVSALHLDAHVSLTFWHKVLAHAPWPEHLYAIECLNPLNTCTSQRLVQTDDSGHNARQIGGTFGGNLGLAVSPDGSQVVLNHYGSDGTDSLYVRSVATGAERRLTAQDPACPTAGTFDNYPSWSPSGTYIAFSRSSSFGFVSCPTDGTYYVAAIGGTPHAVPGSGSPGLTGWDSSSTLLSYIAWKSSYSLFTVKLDGSGRRTLATFPMTSQAGVGAPWAPDAGTIAWEVGSRVIGYVPTSGAVRWAANIQAPCGDAVAWARDSESFFRTTCPSGFEYSSTLVRQAAASTGSQTNILFPYPVEAVAVGL